MVFFSHLQGRPVIDVDKKKLGVLKDLVFIDGDKYAEISHLLIVDEFGLRKKIPWCCIKELKDETDNKRSDIDLYLNLPESKVGFDAETGKEFLVSHLLDKQLVDIDGLRIVRVNDILLGKVDKKFCVVAVDVGAKGLMRRLGVEGISRIFLKNLQDHIIPWEFVESLSDEISNLRVKIQRSKIADLHPADIADLMEDLGHKERVLIFNALDNQTAAETLVESIPIVQQSVFKNLKSKRIADILENMPSHDAADLLGMMPSLNCEELLRLMRPDAAENVRKLLQYKTDVAGGLMNTNFIVIPSSFTAEQTISKLRQLAPSSSHIYYLYVHDDEDRLVGVISLRDLVISSPLKKVSEFMSSDVVSIHVETPKEEIYKAMNKYNIMVLPVVNSKNKLLGVISADDIIDLMIPSSLKRQKLSIRRMQRRRKRKSDNKENSSNNNSNSAIQK